MTRRREMATATALALLLCASVLTAILNWEPLLTQYYVYRLREDPELFDAVLSNPRDRIEEAARDRYLRTSHGRLRLCRRFVDGLLEVLQPQDADFLPKSLRAGQIVSFGLYRISERPYFLVDGPRSIAKPVRADSGVIRLRPFFERIDRASLALADHPGVKMEIWAYKDELNHDEVVVEGAMVREAGDATGAP